MKRRFFTAVMVGIVSLFLVSCSNSQNVSETADSTPTGIDVIEWENDPIIGKVQPGSYKRVGITKKDETYEEMLELQDVENKGILTVNEDGTATFELEGEKTDYIYDEFSFYLAEDTEKTNGFPYVYIGGRIVVNDGSTITQYLAITAGEERANN